MTLRGLRLATQFLTRLPVPGVTDLSNNELARAGVWFPLVGAVVGSLVAAVLLLSGARSEFLGAALAVLAWVWLTGALHLDGLGDLADALAASHRDPKRFLTVLADPHLGAFGVVSIILAIVLKMAAPRSQDHAMTTGLPFSARWRGRCSRHQMCRDGGRPVR